MKFPTRSACVILVCLAALLAIEAQGCIASNPAVQADTAKLSSDQASLTSVNQQIAALQKQLSATTQPADVSALTDQISGLKTQVASLQKQIAADSAQQSADIASVKAAQIQTASTVVTQAGIVAAAVTPQPWGAIIGIVSSIAVGVLGVFATQQKSALATAKGVIAAAAPGVAALVQQTTDNKQLATDVTNIGQVAPGVIDLLSHPSATAVLKATGVIASTLSTSATPTPTPTT